MDTLPPDRRSENMRHIRSKDMKPEMALRRFVHSMGYRYRLHVATLPGKPDLVFASRQKIILVHGCFWHQHQSIRCPIVRMPKSNKGYWGPKLERNVSRDNEQIRALRRMGWSVLVVWECQLRNLKAVSAGIVCFLER
jgi:DNA mismatch endonuclease (patch repair protein)